MREFPKAQHSRSPPREVYSVEQLNQAARTLLETSFAQVWVEGEVSNLTAAGSGHLYFTLKDAAAQVRCAWFRNRRNLIDYAPSDGEHVLVRARVTVYETRGSFQLVIQYLEPAGEGALRLRFEQLKQSLEAEGLFDQARKRPVPDIPARVGVITSPDGAALRDVVTTCRRRCPAVPLVIYPTPVQGDHAPDGVVEALALARRRAECDVLILARGGGSLEDLWTFNEERVARAIADSDIPVVTGIGHETDYTIADFVADRRAPTPTAAAELTVPDETVLLRRIEGLRISLIAAVTRKIERDSQRNDICAHRLIHPTRRYAQARQRFTLMFGRLHAAVRQSLAARSVDLARASQSLLRNGPGNRLVDARWRIRHSEQRFAAAGSRIPESARQRLAAVTGRLNAVSPLATLDRGYAVVTDADGAVVIRSDQVQEADVIDVRLAQGGLLCRIEEITS